MSDFSIKRDWKQINWKATFQYNVFRSICSVPMWALLIVISGQKLSWIILLFPLIYFGFWLPLGLLCGWLARIGVPFIGILSMVSSLVIVVGDPIVWIIHKIKPDLVPAESPRFLDFHLIVFITHNPDALPACDLEGRIVSDENIQFMGETFPLRKTLFIIKPDWSVETLKDKNFGFVDVQGAIKKGRLQKGIDPRETNIGEMVAYIVEGVCYSPQQQRMGQYDTMPEPVLTSNTGNSYTASLADKLTEIEKTRRILRSDFEAEDRAKLCKQAGLVHAFKGISFMNTVWDEDEVMFDINLLGEVKTPYDGDFGHIEGSGEIIKGEEDSDEVVAKVLGNYCYAGNQKIGQFKAQTD